jgi:hypothetical protein
MRKFCNAKRKFIFISYAWQGQVWEHNNKCMACLSVVCVIRKTTVSFNPVAKTLSIHVDTLKIQV